MAKVLLFQCGNEMEIRQALTPMKISVASVPAEHFYHGPYLEPTELYQ